MADQNPKPARPTPLMIGLVLGLGLMVLLLLSSRGGQRPEVAEPHPWRVLTVNNSAVHRRGLPLRVICPLPEGANVVSDPTADCYFRTSIQYNPLDEIAVDSDCQLASGFASLVVGVGQTAVVVDSQPVDLAGDDGNCGLTPGSVVNFLLQFESVPRTEKLSLIRFAGIDPPLELEENLSFVIDRP